jgi:hypothetical protein
MNLISTIQGRLGSQPFAFNFTEEILYDVSLFMFNELRHGVGQQVVAEILEKREAHLEPSSNDFDDPISDIRKEVESELREEIEEITDGQEEDVFSKAERLKRLAQQRKTGTTGLVERPKISATKKTGISVKRAQ